VAAAGRLRYFYLARFSKPRHDRPLYRQIRKRCATRFVELGIGHCQRALRMITVAQRYAQTQVHYTGIDLFEAQPESTPHLKLKEAHRLLTRSGAKTRLIPGEGIATLAAQANNLLATDVLIIPQQAFEVASPANWFYIPRMLHAQSLILRQIPGATEKETRFAEVSYAEICKLAGGRPDRRAA